MRAVVGSAGAMAGTSTSPRPRRAPVRRVPVRAESVRRRLRDESLPRVPSLPLPRALPRPVSVRTELGRRDGMRMPRAAGRGERGAGRRPPTGVAVAGVEAAVAVGPRARRAVRDGRGTGVAGRLEARVAGAAAVPGGRRAGTGRDAPAPGRRGEGRGLLRGEGRGGDRGPDRCGGEVVAVAAVAAADAADGAGDDAADGRRGPVAPRGRRGGHPDGGLARVRRATADVAVAGVEPSVAVGVGAGLPVRHAISLCQAGAASSGADGCRSSAR